MLHDEARCEGRPGGVDVGPAAHAGHRRDQLQAVDVRIARNAAIDSYRRNSHAVEVSMDADDGLRASDRTRLVGVDGGPDAALLTKERLNHLQSASTSLRRPHRAAGDRELEGMSYREISDSSTSRGGRRQRAVPGPPPARQQYQEITEGRGRERRCARRSHAWSRTCTADSRAPARAARETLPRLPAPCSRARDPAAVPVDALRDKAAAMLPIPWLFRRSAMATASPDSSLGRGLGSDGGAGRGLVATAAIAGAGGAAVSGGALGGEREAAREDRPAAAQSTAGRESQRGATGHVTDGERAGARRASGRTASGPVGDRARGSGGTETIQPGGTGAAPGVGAPAAGAAPSIRTRTAPPRRCRICRRASRGTLRPRSSST